MIRKYHNHQLQTNTWHREEEPHNYQETPQSYFSLIAKIMYQDIKNVSEYKVEMPQLNIADQPTAP